MPVPIRFPFHRVPLGLLAITILAATACAPSPPALRAIDHLSPCLKADGPDDAYCGSLTVPEDRSKPEGRQLSLKVVVLPALSRTPAPDPLFFLAGGPGQGAATMADLIGQMFGRVQTDRDIVLVDQRGTGGSGGLECASSDDSLSGINEPSALALDRLRACLASYGADTRMYTTPVAMDDLDAVRMWLGYDRINLYGGSYGTRAALAYLRQHGDHVRSVVLDGVAPPDLRLPLFFARDAQRALDRMFAACDTDPTCAGRHPDLARRVAALFARLDARPATVTLAHPRTGVVESVTMTAPVLASIVASALYSPLTTSMLPELLTRAERDEYQGLVALATLGDSVAENMSVGMHFSVICAEDVPRITEDDLASVTANTIFGRHLMRQTVETCGFWPAGTVSSDYFTPVTSAVPALVLSGDLDPVTPPSWGAAVASTLSHSLHVIAPQTGHGVVATGCGVRMVADFLAAGTPDGLDTSCVEAITRPPFFMTPTAVTP
jgi:pimeloyl-ACP methyl ester carboxylesterase